MKVLYCAISFCKETNEQRMETFHLNNIQQTETKIQMNMVNEFKLTVVHFVCPNTMQICACT